MGDGDIFFQEKSVTLHSSSGGKGDQRCTSGGKHGCGRGSISEIRASLDWRGKGERYHYRSNDWRGGKKIKGKKRWKKIRYLKNAELKLDKMWGGKKR